MLHRSVRWYASHNTVSTISSQTDHRYPDTFSGRFANWLTGWGKSVLDSIIALGDFGLFVFRMFGWMFTRGAKPETLWPNFHTVGVLSLPVVALTGTFIGMVLAVQSYFQFKQLGLETHLGAVINMSLVRELGPCLLYTSPSPRDGLLSRMPSSA